MLLRANAKPKPSNARFICLLIDLNASEVFRFRSTSGIGAKPPKGRSGMSLTNTADAGREDTSTTLWMDKSALRLVQPDLAKQAILRWRNARDGSPRVTDVLR